MWAFARFNTFLTLHIIAFARSLESSVLNELVNPLGGSVGILVHFRNDSVVNGFVELIRKFVIQRIATGIDTSLDVGEDIAIVRQTQLQIDVYRVIEQDLTNTQHSIEILFGTLQNNPSVWSPGWR